jgi:hypothetical protein
VSRVDKQFATQFESLYLQKTQEEKKTNLYRKRENRSWKAALLVVMRDEG